MPQSDFVEGEKMAPGSGLRLQKSAQYAIH